MADMPEEKQERKALENAAAQAPAASALAAPTTAQAPAVLTEETPDDGKSEWLYMKHPKIEKVAGPIQRQAFIDLWQHKGWEIAPKPAEQIPV